MNVFHIITMIVALVVFLGLFIYTMVVYSSDRPTTFPKDMTSCPDFWTVNPDGTCQIPTPAPGKSEPALNVGKLTDSQQTTYTVYTYPTSAPDNGNTLDSLLDIPNISFLPQYNDPGTFVPIKYARTGTSVPKGTTRPKATQSGSSGADEYRYDISNNIPYGYSIRQPGAIDFNDRGWASYGDPYCAIQSWSKQNGIQWDSMAAYNRC